MSHHDCHPDHNHDHHHDHHHDHADGAVLDFGTKLTRRLEHWRHHNEDHLQGYQQWAEAAGANGCDDVAAHLQAVLTLSRQITEHLEKALEGLHAQG